jgi:translation initiation factor IF-2
MNEANEGEKPAAAAQPRRLELKKTVETGSVRQSFSHGRSKTVTVEVKKRRLITRPDGTVGEAPAAAKPVAAAPPLQARAPAAPLPPLARPAGPTLTAPAHAPAEAPRPAFGSGVVLKQLSEEEKASRARALQDFRAEAGIARKKAEDETRHRAVEEARLAAEHLASERRAAEEEARKKSEEEAKRRAEDEAARRMAASAAAAELSGAPSPRTAAQALLDDEAAESARRGRGRAVPGRAPSPRPGLDAERRGGKLTVTRALDDNERTRSLAAFRRAREREKRLAQAVSEPPKKVVRQVVIPESITVQELASRMAERGADVIKSLMKMGVMATINQTIDADTAELVVSEFGHKMQRVTEGDVETGLVAAPDVEGVLLPRAPVVTVMGHVDHGKTSLLDALRQEDVAAHEAGGITQHIGAYKVLTPHGREITFLDTPGHEAFTAMRARGAKATDIVVLVVAADDGVMPQTIEAIRHALAAKVPIVVAINKCDKPDANPDKVRRDLLQHGIALEGHGGDVLSVEVSAKTKVGLDKLEEIILLQAEVLDLKANPNRLADGIVIEAKLDRGRGPVATVLVQRGTLRTGDIVVAGSEYGRVRALVDERGRNLDSAGPATPVEVVGWQGAPEAGDEFTVVETETRAREVAEYRQRRQRLARTTTGGRGTMEQMFSRIKAGEAKELGVVVKTDVQGSLEAIVGAANKLSGEEVAVRVLHGGIGAINESDITLARASGGIVIGFNVRASKQARDLAQRDGVDIRYYSIIYNIVDDLKALLTGMMAPKMRENFLGYAEIRQVFDITKVGKVAGCMVTEGTVKRGARVRLLRDNVVIHEGTLSTLKRFKDEVKEVKQGMECGMAFENYADIKQSDVIECFEMEEVARQIA